jgi:hypothetical protein
LRNCLAGHLFQAQTLRAELDFIGAMELRLAALEFDRKRRFAVRLAMEFDEVGDADEAEAVRGQRHCRNAPYAARIALAWLVCGEVNDASLGGEAVFLPQPFDVNQRGLT